MRWVADTGPLLHLAEAGAPHLFSMLGEVAVPPAVVSELTAMRPAVHPPPAVRVVLLDAAAAKQGEDWRRAGLVHRGEAQALALARQWKADVFLTDDAAARMLAVSLGQQARGSLGIVLWLAARRQITPSDASRHLDELSRTSLWLAPEILGEAHAALRKMNLR
jgi:predicted nucleic acid-binding protein